MEAYGTLSMTPYLILMGLGWRGTESSGMRHLTGAEYFMFHATNKTTRPEEGPLFSCLWVKSVR